MPKLFEQFKNRFFKPVEKPYLYNYDDVFISWCLSNYF